MARRTGDGATWTHNNRCRILLWHDTVAVMFQRRSAFLLALPLLVAATPAVPAISAYVGKYQFDKVRGVAFPRHPLVVQRVKAALAGSGIQSRVLDPNSTSVPIARQGDFIVSWACERHNCGSHQWAIVLTGSGRKASVCYYNEDLSEGARWFVDGKVGLVSPEGDCQFEAVPDQIALMLVR